MMKTESMTVLLAVALLTGCAGKEEKGIKAPTRVKTEVVGTSDSKAHLQTYVGTVEEREATAVSFTGLGVVRRVLVSEGQTVAYGQLLAEMDDTQARNMLAGAEAQVAQAEDALQRYGQLHDSGSMTEAQWVEVQSKVAQARSALEVARKNVADCRLVAPVGGIIGRKLLGVGETARPSQAVVTILDISSVKVKVAVPEGEVAAIDPNTSSYIRVDAVGRTYEGGRIEKGVVADAMTHTYDLRINVDNRDRRLLPGMVASVKMRAAHVAQPTRQSQEPTEESEKVTGEKLLPVTAVQRRAEGQLFVWTVSADSTAHRTAVSIGQTVGNRVAITDGLTGGERVVTEGYQKLSEGSRVTF